jgi:hypothetical protein
MFALQVLWGLFGKLVWFLLSLFLKALCCLQGQEIKIPFLRSEFVKTQNARTMKRCWLIVILALFFLCGPTEAVFAENDAISIADVKQGLDTVWVLIAAFLVFFMQAGFGMVEAGFIRAKNTCNI